MQRKCNDSFIPIVFNPVDDMTENHNKYLLILKVENGWAHVIELQVYHIIHLEFYF